MLISKKKIHCTLSANQKRDDACEFNIMTQYGLSSCKQPPCITDNLGLTPPPPEGAGYSPISGIKVCAAPKGMVFKPFWSEKGYRF